MADRITLKIPAKPDYLLTARLAASSVASRMGFDVNDIEDIKTATAESLLIIIYQQKSEAIDITFINKEESLSVEAAGVPGSSPEIECDNEDGSLSRYLIEALADESMFEEKDGNINKIHFSKNLQR